MKNKIDDSYSDDHLIASFLKGDTNCFGILYSRYYSKVYAKCYSFTRNNDDAFDMTQEILLKAICNVSSFGGNSKFSTWLYAVSTNYCITQANRNSRKYREDISAAYQIIEERTEDEDFEAREKREKLELNLDKYLKLLSDEERQMLELKYRKKYSVKDLQKEFGLSASAVKMRLLRARMKMNQIISLELAA